MALSHVLPNFNLKDSDIDEMTQHKFKSEQEHHLLSNQQDTEEFQDTKSQSLRWQRAKPHIILVAVYSFVLALTVFSYSLTASSSRQQHWPSPASDIIEYHDVRFNGTLTHHSPYKGPPSQEVDQRWDNIAMLEPFGVSERTIRELGKDPTKAVKMPDGEKYLASVEVIHQLHCLNLIRQASNYDFYEKPVFRRMGNRAQQMNHIDHCVDLLRQALMCQADTGLITYAWVPFSDHPTPDFNTMHKCRNFDAIREWVVDQAPEKPVDHRKPASGAYIWGNLP